MTVGQTEDQAAPPDPWELAALAAALFAVDPIGTGGVALRALPGPVREQWLADTRELLPPGTPRRKIPLHVADGRLLGGLDLAATLRAGRPVAEHGILAEADGGVVELAMAERVKGSPIAYLCAALDTGEVVLERDGIALRSPARLGVIALDEGHDEDERVADALVDRLAFLLDLSPIGIREMGDLPYGPGGDRRRPGAPALGHHRDRAGGRTLWHRPGPGYPFHPRLHPGGPGGTHRRRLGWERPGQR